MASGIASSQRPPSLTELRSELGVPRVDGNTTVSGRNGSGVSRFAMRVMLVAGTRPEAIKLAPVVLALRAAPGIDSLVLTTGQHRELALEVFDLFGIQPDVDLAIMRANQTPTQVAAAVLTGLEPHLTDWHPDWVVVQGDTTTVLAATIAAHYGGIRVAHVEAGLRSHDRRNPFPEEFNRVLTSHAVDLHFAPTDGARDNLLREGIPSDRIVVTGNPVVDALHHFRGLEWEPGPADPLSHLPADKRLLLVTTHRRESFGPPLERICQAVSSLARRPDVHVVVPVHPNPQVSMVVRERLTGATAITLVDPLDYRSLVWLMHRSHLILTDSGGIQEEAPSLGKPVLILREVTERPEGIAAGCAELVGTEIDRIVAVTTELLDDTERYGRMAHAANPYGDGHAAERIVRALLTCDPDGERPADMARMGG